MRCQSATFWLTVVWTGPFPPSLRLSQLDHRPVREPIDFHGHLGDRPLEPREFISQPLIHLNTLNTTS